MGKSNIKLPVTRQLLLSLFLPHAVHSESEERIIDAWITDECHYFRKWIARIYTATAMGQPLFFYLDTFRDSYNPSFSQILRISNFLIFLGVSTLLISRFPAKGTTKFVFDKLTASFAIFYMIACHFMWMNINHDIPRCFPGILLIIGTAILRLETKSTATFCVIHALMLALFTSIDLPNLNLVTLIDDWSIQSVSYIAALAIAWHRAKYSEFFVFQHKEKNLLKTQIVNTKEILERHTSVSESAQSIAHDLKLPMTNIERIFYVKSYADFLEIRDTALSSFYRLQTIIEGFRQADADAIVKPQLCAIDLSAIVREAIAAYDLPDGIITLRTDPILEHVSIDKPKFERAILNIIDNAIEAGAQKIVIEAHISEKDLLLDILDNGPGVPSEIKDTLFQRGTSFGKASGIGVGLSYVKTVMEGHGGSITYIRDDGISIFRCLLKSVMHDDYDDPNIAISQRVNENSPAHVVVILKDKNRQYELMMRLKKMPAIAVKHQSTEPCHVIYTDNIDFQLWGALYGAAVIIPNSHDNIEKVVDSISRRAKTRMARQRDNSQG